MKINHQKILSYVACFSLLLIAIAELVRALSWVEFGGRKINVVHGQIFMVDSHKGTLRGTYQGKMYDYDFIKGTTSSFYPVYKPFNSVKTSKELNISHLADVVSGFAFLTWILGPFCLLLAFLYKEKIKVTFKALFKKWNNRPIGVSKIGPLQGNRIAEQLEEDQD